MLIPNPSRGALPTSASTTGCEQELILGGHQQRRLSYVRRAYPIHRVEDASTDDTELTES